MADKLTAPLQFATHRLLARKPRLEDAPAIFEGVLRRHILHPNIAPEPRDCRMYARVKS